MQALFKTEWSSPSNIALVKYWGKHGVQLPQNPSLSFTLKDCNTVLSIEVYSSVGGSIEFKFEGQSNLKFQEKISLFLKSQVDVFSWQDSYHLKIESKNTFPHSSGIASSASSMSALCLALLSVDEFITGKKLEEREFYLRASELSRLASGSASRSVYPMIVSWGKIEGLPGSSDYFAQSFREADSVFHDFCDSILIVDAKEKSVSSRAGHSLMENHLYSQVRYQQARSNMEVLIKALKEGDLETFIEVVEEEALTLHALMMTSRPSYILLRPESLRLIEEIRTFRKKENLPVCFTIDAGPNIHLLYPKKHATVVRRWIENTLSINGLKCIHDEVGMGPVHLSKI